MQQALTYFYYFFEKCLDYVFNTMEIAQNVTVGWVIVSVLVMSMLIRSILNVPKSAHLNHKYEYTTVDAKGKHVRTVSRRTV